MFNLSCFQLWDLEIDSFLFVGRTRLRVGAFLMKPPDRIERQPAVASTLNILLSLFTRGANSL